MKQRHFTPDERNLLILVIKKRLEHFNIHNYNIESNNDEVEKRVIKSFRLKPFLLALNKISNIETTTYNTKEIASFISCINENYRDFNNGLDLPTALSWLTITNHHETISRKIDICKDILFKCGYFNKKSSYIRYDKQFRYSDKLFNIEKLKNCDKVFLSKAGENNYYKIGFIYNNKEYLPFELKDKVSLDNTNFISLNGQSPEDLAPKNFSLITTKPKAKELIANCESIYYPEGVLDFMNVLLT